MITFFEIKFIFVIRKVIDLDMCILAVDEELHAQISVLLFCSVNKILSR